MDKQVVSTDRVAPPLGAYSHAIRTGNLLFIAGQVAVDREGKVMGKGDAVAQTRQVMENIKAILEAAGATFDNVVKLNTFVTDMGPRVAMGEVRRSYLREPYPASTVVQVTKLAHPDFMVEVEAVAAL